MEKLLTLTILGAALAVLNNPVLAIDKETALRFKSETFPLERR